ncbi:hypothetical protein [Kibdelosporangium phytohabitans]|uniref:Uncharacterized protein n=1 Tax=Kibdelosporangium phytohabitans TaxID=860235 RepID=A0A0N9I481_9PSEU|nr:hypothetical protein [Kibdelosporangium phytohabitans]ALG10457.1 hypothetical protein AOZ06_29355 [Kibdelosporangium phytohabitans]MBE1461530.1 hypothetical protein [Kibdelosporangium phytohabitans]
MRIHGSPAQQDLDGSAFGHGPVGVSGLAEREFEVENLAGVDLAVPDQVEQVRQVLPYRGRAAMQVNVGEEQFLDFAWTKLGKCPTRVFVLKRDGKGVATDAKLQDHKR